MFALRDTVCEPASIPRLDDNPRDFCLATVRAIPISLETSDPCREIVLSLSLLLLSSTVRKRFETRYSLLDRRRRSPRLPFDVHAIDDPASTDNCTDKKGWGKLIKENSCGYHVQWNGPDFREWPAFRTVKISGPATNGTVGRRRSGKWMSPRVEQRTS